MAKQLTRKQREFIQGYLETDNGTKAAMVVYDVKSERVAASIASENLTKPNIRTAIDEALRRKNIGPDRWATVLDRALEAETELVIGPGQTKTKPDYGIRLKAVDLSAKLADAYPHEPAARHEHRHLHLESNEPIEVIRFKVLHGRAPTVRELKELLQPDQTPEEEETG